MSGTRPAFLISTPVVFYSGWPFLAGCARELRERRLGADTLVATSVLLAYFASLFATFTGAGPDSLRDRLDTAARAATQELGQLSQWLRDEYVPRAADVPDGVGLDRYRLGVRQFLGAALDPEEARVVVSRAILGEWLGGSGGGWQDSGGIFPGIKLIQGVAAGEDDPEWGISRGRLLPSHELIATDDKRRMSDDKSNGGRRPFAEALAKSLVLVHGGMAQNVGPILEMVSEKYLLRSAKEWEARQGSLALFDQIYDALRQGDIRRLGALTTEHFFGPLYTIIPWCTTFFTERLIDAMKAEFGADFWGFWMLGGMSGGGMGFIFAPKQKSAAQHFLKELMSDTKRELQNALPFAMEPVVYDFAINPRGTHAELLRGNEALLPPSYYALMAPQWLRTEPRELSPLRRGELDRFGAACRTRPTRSARGTRRSLRPKPRFSSTDICG